MLVCQSLPISPLTGNGLSVCVCIVPCSWQFLQLHTKLHVAVAETPAESGEIEADKEDFMCDAYPKVRKARVMCAAAMRLLPIVKDPFLKVAMDTGERGTLTCSPHTGRAENGICPWGGNTGLSQSREMVSSSTQG